MAKNSVEWTGPVGGNWVYMIKNQKAIGEFIRANGLKPVQIGAINASQTTARSTRALIDLGIRGGITPPHLHFRDKIYLLNAEQWAQFSRNIIADAKAKLAKVSKVSFEEGMVIGSVAQRMTR